MRNDKKETAAKFIRVGLALLSCLSVALLFSHKRSERIPNAFANSAPPMDTALVESPADSAMQTSPKREMSEASLQDKRGAFLECLWESISQFEDGGGYDTSYERASDFSQSVWEGIHRAFVLNPGGVPTLNPSVARPSFCSSACYLALMNALCIWDGGKGRVSQAAWTNLKPYVLRKGGAWPYQEDGMGCWGRANANGPGFALFAAQLGVGVSGYIDGDGKFETTQ